MFSESDRRTTGVQSATTAAKGIRFATIAGSSAICAGLGGTFDLLQKVAPAAWYGIGASAVALLCTYVLYRKKRLLQQEWRNIGLALAIILFGLTCLKVAQLCIPNAETNGVFATKIETIADFQSALFPTLSKIEQSTRETAAGIARVQGTLEGVKRETSDDPLKELANLGITNPHDGWVRAFLYSDARMMALLLSSNSTPDRLTLYYRLAHGPNDESAPLSPGVFKILRKIKPLVQKAICDVQQPASVSNLLRNMGKEEYVYYCGLPAGVIKKYKESNEQYWRSYCAQKAKFKIDCKQNDIEPIIKAFADSDTVDSREKVALKEILDSFKAIRKVEGTGP